MLSNTVMDEEERQKKLDAGKQKLAAYRKKKNKPKKPKSTSGTDSEVTESEASSVIDVTDLGALSDVSDTSLSSLTTEFVQNGKDISEDGYEEMKISPRAMDTARRELTRAHERVTHLEETLLGKEALLEILIKENEQLKSEVNTGLSQKVKVTSAGIEGTLDSPDLDTDVHTVEECKKKIAECQSAIEQRDSVIRQLSDNLKATTDNRDTLQAEYQAQAEQLASQVHLLQEQLRQTGDWLNQHSGEHGISAQALLEAKNELLALQQVNKEKDSQILQLQSAMQERDQTITHLVEKFNSSAENFEKMKTAYIHLQQEAMVLKHEKSSTSGGKIQLELASLKKSYSEVVQQLSETTEMRLNYQILQKENEELKTKNEKFKKKDKESGQVIKHLMGNIETLQKGQVPLSPISPSSSSTSILSSSSVSDIDQELSSLRAELEESHGEQIVQMKGQLQDQHKVEVDRLSRELGMVRGERDKLNTQVKEWQNMYMSLSQTGASGADLSMEIHALRTENSMYKDHINDLTSQVQALKQEQTDLKKDGQFSSSGAKVTGEDRSELRKQCAKYKQQVEELSKELHSLHSERGSVLFELQDSQEKLHSLDTLHSKLKTYESMVATLEDKLSVVVKEREDSVTEIERLRSALRTIQEKTDVLVVELGNTQNSLEQTQGELQSAKNKLEEMDQLLTKEQAELKQTMTHYTETENELLKTRSIKLKLESELDNAKQDIEKINEAHKQEMLVVQNQFEMRLKMEVEESNIELQKSKLEVETLRTQSSSADKSSQSSDIEALQSKYQAEIDRVKNEYTQYIQQIQSTYEAQFKSAQEQWQAAHETQIKSVQEQLTKAQQNQLVELQEKLNKAHEVQVKDIQTRHELEMQRIINDGAVKTQEFEKQLQNVYTKHNEHLDQVVKDLTEKHHKDIVLLQQQYDANVDIPKYKYSSDLVALQAHCDNETGSEQSIELSSNDPSTVYLDKHHHHHHHHTTQVIQSKTIKSSHIVKSRTLVRERIGENITEQGQSMHSIMVDSAQQYDSGVSLPLSQSSQQTELSDIPEGRYIEADVVDNLQSQISELETIVTQLQTQNQSLQSQLESVAPKDVHSQSVQQVKSDGGQIQAYEQQIAMLLQQNAAAHEQIKELSVKITEQSKQLSQHSSKSPEPTDYDKDVFEVPIKNANPEGSQMVKVEVFATKEVSTSIGDEYEEHYTSALDNTGNVSTTSDVYVSANEASMAESATSDADWRERLSKSESEKQELINQVKSIQQSSASVNEKFVKLEKHNKYLIEANARLSTEMEMSTEETLSELKEKIDVLKTEKSSLETLIFYKDLEISKLLPEKVDSSVDTSVQGSLYEQTAEISSDEKPVAQQSEGKEVKEQEMNVEVLSELKETVERLKKELSIKDCRIEELTNQVDAQEADYERLKMEIADEGFEIERLSTEASYFKKDKKQSQQLKQKITTLEDEKQGLNTTIDELEIDIGELKVNMDCKDIEIEELKKEASDSQVNNQEPIVKGQTVALTSQAKQTVESDHHKEVVKDHKTEVELQTQLLLEESINLKREMDKMHQEKTALETKFNKLSEDNTTLQMSMQILKNEYEEHKGQYSELNVSIDERERVFIAQATEAENCISELRNQLALLESVPTSVQVAEIKSELPAAVDKSMESKVASKLATEEKKNLELVEELKRLEKEWKAQRQQPKDQSEKVKFKKLSEKLQHSKEALQELASNVAKLELNEKTYIDTIDELSAKEIELSDKVNQTEANKTELEAQLKEARKAEAQLKGELEHYISKEVDLKQKISQVEDEATEKVKSNETIENELRFELKQLKLTGEEMTEKVSLANTVQVEMNDKLCQAESALADMNTQLTEANGKVIELSEKLNVLTEEKKEMMEMLNAKDSEKSELFHKLTKLESSMKEITNKVNELEGEKEDNQRKMIHNEEVVSTLTVQCAELRQEKKDVEAISSSLKTELQQVKAEKEQHNQLHQQQMANLKDDQAKVLSHYESLIESFSSEKGDFAAEFDQMREMMEEKQALVNDMQEEIATLRLTNESLVLEQEKEVERLMNQKNELESEKVDALENVKDLQKELDVAQQSNKDITAENVERDKSMNDLESRLKTIEKEKVSLHQESLNLQQSLNEMKTATDEKDKAVEKLNTELSEAQKDKEALAKQISENELLSQKVSDQDVAFSSLQGETSVLQKFITELKTTVDEKVKTIEQVNSHLKVTEKDKEMLSQQVADKEGVVSSLQGETNGLQNFITELKSNCDEKDQNIKHLNSHLQEIESEKEMLSQQLSEKEEAISSLQGENNVLLSYIGELKSAGDEKDKSSEEAKSYLKEFESSCQDLSQQVSVKEEEVSSLQNANSKLQESVRELQIMLQEKDKVSQDVTLSLKGIAEEKQALLKNISEKEATISSLHSEVTDLQSSLDEKNQKVEAYNKIVKETLEKVEQLSILLEEKETRIVALSEEKSIVSKSNQELENSVQQEKKSSLELSSKSESLQKQVDNLKSLNEKLLERVKSCQTEFKSKTTELESANKETKSLKKHFKDSNQEKARLETLVAELRCTLVTSEDEKNRLDKICKELSDEVNELKRDISVHQSESVNLQSNYSEKSEKLQSKCEKLEEENATLNARVIQFQQNTDELKKMKSQLETEKDNVEKVIKVIRCDNQALKATLEESKHEQKVQFEQLNKESDSRQTEKVQLQHSVTVLETAKVNIEKDNEKLKTEVEKLKSDLMNLTDNKKDVDKKLSDMTEKCRNIEKENSSFKAEIDKQKHEVQKTKNARDTLETQLKQLNTDIRRFQEGTGQQDATIEYLKVEKETLKQELNNLTDEWSKMNSKNESLGKDIDSLKHVKQDNESYSVKNNTLQQEVQSLKIELTNIKTKMESDIVNFKAELSQKASECQSLNSSKSDIQVQMVTEKEEMQKSLDGLVKEKQQLQQKVDSLDGDIKSLNVALEKEKEDSSQKLSDFELKCESLHKNIQNLQEEKNQQSVQLGDNIQSLSSEKESLKSECCVLTDENQKFKAHLQRLQTELQNSSEQFNVLKEHETNLSEANSNYKIKEVPELMEKIVILEGERKKGSERIAELETQLNTVQSDKDSLLKTIKDLENNLESIKSTLTSEKGDLSNELYDLKTQLEGALQDKKQLQQELTGVSEQKAQKDRENEKSVKEVEKLKQEKCSVETDMNSLQESMDRLLQEHETTTNDYDEAVLKNKALEEEVKSSQNRKQTLESENNSLEEEMRLLRDEGVNVMANIEEYQKEAENMKEKISQLTEKNAVLNSEMDLMRSENLSLQTEKEVDKEKDSVLIADLTEQVKSAQEEKQSLEEEFLKTTEEFRTLQQTHSDAIGEFEKQIKNLYNLAERLEKENKKLQNRVVETVNESDSLKEKLDSVRTDYHDIAKQFDEKLTELQRKETDTGNLRAKLKEMEGENDALKIKIEENEIDLRDKIKVLEEENLRLKNEEYESVDMTDGGVDTDASKKDSIDDKQKSLEVMRQDVLEKMRSLENEVKKYQEERQLMEASMENVKYERDRLKDQVVDLEKSIKDSSDGEYVNVSVRYEQEITTLKRSLETILSEREAMKETFDEDLTRLSRQVEEKENERIQLQHEIQGLTVDSASGMLHSTPRQIETEHGRIRHSTNKSQNIEDMHLSGVGAGLMSDSMQFENEDLQMLQSCEVIPEGNFAAEEQQELHQESQEYAPTKKAMPTPNNFGGFGIFSDSCKLQTSDFVSVDPEDLPDKKEIAASVMSAPTGPAVKVEGSVREVIERYEQKLTEIREQHSIEMKVAEYNMSETNSLKMKQLRATIRFELEEEYKQKTEELNNQFQQKMNSMKKDLQANFVTELQKARQEIEKCQKGDADTTSEPDDSQVTDEIVKLRRKLERLEEAKIELLGSIDTYNNREAGLNEEILVLTEVKDHLSAENVKLKQQLSLYTDHATIESASEFNSEEWRVKYDSVLKGKDAMLSQAVDRQGSPCAERTDSQPSNLNDIGDGSLPTSQEISSNVVATGLHEVEGGLQLDSGDIDELRNQLDALQSENEALKLKLRNQSLGIDESMSEELLDAQFKYQMILQEKETLLRHFHRMGIDPSALSVEIEPETRRRSQSHDTDITEDSLNDDTPPHASLDEDFIDWKLKYEVVEKENESLKSKLDSSSIMLELPQRNTPSLNTTPQFVISTGEFKNRHSALVEQNEMLRAHLGSRGLYIDRSLEGDTLDMHFQLETLANENEKLKQHLEDYDKGELSADSLQVPGSTSGTKSRTMSRPSSESSDVNWRHMFESLCKEHEAVKSELAKVKDSPVSNQPSEGESVTSQLQSAIEDDNSLAKSQHPKVSMDDAKDTAIMYEQLQTRYETMKAELTAAKDKAKKDLTKMKAKNVVATREIEKLKKKLQSYESQESVNSVLSAASDSSTAEDSGFVVVDTDKDTPGETSAVSSDNASISSDQSGESLSKHTVETIVKESFTEVYTSKSSSSHTTTVVQLGTSDPDQMVQNYPHLEAELKSLKDENTQLQRCNKRLESQLQRLQLSKSGKSKEEQQQKDSDEKYIDLCQEVEELEKYKWQLQKENTELRSQVKRIQQAKKESVQQIEDQYKSLMKEHQNLKSQLAGSIEKLEKYNTLVKENEQLKSRQSQDKEWHDADLQGLQGKYDVVIGQKQVMEKRISVLESEKEEISREFTMKLNESLKQVTEFKSEVILIQTEKRKTCDKLTEVEEKLQHIESAKCELEQEIKRFSVSEQKLQVKNSEFELANASLKEQLSMLQSSVNNLSSVSSVSVHKLHENDISTCDVNNSTDNFSEINNLFIQSSASSSSVCNQRMNVHDGLMHGDAFVQGEGVYTSSNSSHQASATQSKTQFTHAYIQTDISLKSDQSLQIISPNKILESPQQKDTINSIRSQVGFQPITNEVLDSVSVPTMSVEPKLKSYDDLVREVEELQEQYNHVIEENSHLMHLLEDLETQLSDAKYQLSALESTNGLLNENGAEKLTTKVSSSEYMVPEIDGGRDSKSDESSFYVKDAVRVSITEELGEDSDTGRVVDVQTVPPTGAQHDRSFEEEEKSMTPKSVKKSESKTPKSAASSKRATTPKTKDLSNRATKSKARDIKQESMSPKTSPRTEKTRSGLSKAVSEAELSTDALRKERDRLARENRQLAEKVNQMSKASTELNSLKVRYDRLNKEKRDLQTKYDRDVSRVSHPKKKSDIEDGRKTKQEKSKLEKDIASLRTQIATKDKENQELLKVIHQSGKLPEEVNITQLRIQYEILLTEKEQMSTQFEEEKSTFLETIKEMERKAELLELERNEAIEFDISSHQDSESPTEQEVTRLKRHLQEVTLHNRTLEQENRQLNEQLQGLMDQKQKVNSDIQKDKFDLQQRINDLNAKIEVMETEDSELRSQLQLTKIEKTEIKSELEERLKQLEQQNREQQAFIQSTTQSNDQQMTTTITSAVSQDYSAPLSLEIPSVSSQYAQMPSGSSSSSSKISHGHLSPASQRTAITLAGFDIESDNSSISELRLQYEILMQEKRELCSKLEKKDEVIKQLQLDMNDAVKRLDDSQTGNDMVREEFESQKIQYELLIDEKNELCVQLDKEKGKVVDTKERLRTVTEQLLESQRESHSLRSRCDILRREISHEEPEDDCFETEEESSAKTRTKELEGKVFELTVQLEKVEQDLEANSNKLWKAHKKVEASSEEKRGSLVKLENELQGERQRLQSMKDELEDFKFKYDELEAHIETVQQENEDLSKKLSEMKDSKEQQEKVVSDLKVQIEGLNNKNSKLGTENERLKLTLGDKEQEVADKMNELQEALDDCLTGKQALWSEISELKTNLKASEEKQNGQETENKEEKKKNKESQEQIELLQNAVYQSKETNDILSKDVSNAKTQLEQVTLTILNVTTENANLRDQKITLEKALLTLQSHAQEVNEQIMAIHTEYGKLQEDRTLSKQSVVSLTDKVKKLEEEILTLNTAKENLLKDNSALEVEQNNLQQKLLSVGTKNSAEVDELTNLKAVKEKENVALKNEVDVLTKEKYRLEDDIQNIVKDKVTLGDQVTSLETKLADLSKVKEELEQSKNQLKSLQQEFSSHKKHIETLQSELVTCEHCKCKLEAEIDKLKDELHQKHSEVKKWQDEYLAVNKEHKLAIISMEKSQTEMTEIKTRMAVNDKEMTIIKENIQILEHENSKLNDKCSMLEDDSKKDTLELEKQVLELKYAVEMKIRENKDAEEKNKQLKSEVQNLQAAMVDLEKKKLEEQSLLNRDVESLQSTLCQKSEQYEKLELEFNQFEGNVNLIKTELESVKLEKEKFEKENTSLKSENISTLSENEDLTSHLDNSRMEMVALLEDKNNVEEESNQRKLQIDILSENKIKLEKEVVNLQKSLKEIEQEKSSSEISLKQVIKEDLNRIRTDCVTTGEDVTVTQLEAQITNLKTEICETKTDNHRLIKEINRLESQLKMNEEESKVLKKTLDERNCNIQIVNTSEKQLKSGAEPSEEACISSNEICAKCQGLQTNFEKLQIDYKEMSSKYHQSMVPPDVDRTEVDAVDIGADLNISDLQEENAQLFKQKNDLENQLMTLRGDNNDLTEKLNIARAEFKKELDILKERLGDYQSLCDTVSTSKEKLEQELQRQRNEYEANLSKLRLEKLEENVKDKDKIDNIVQQIADSERKASELRDDLRTVEEEKGLLQLRVAHLMRECKLYDRHIKDLEKEVEMQVVQIQDAMQEHKETIRMLAELRLEQEMSKKEQKGEFSRIDSKLKLLETEISTNRSTPLAMSVASAPVHRAQSSNSESLCSFTDDGRVRSDIGAETDGDRALSMKHFQMIEELNRLYRDLQESKEARETLNRENKSLRDTLERERARSTIHQENNETMFLDSAVDWQRPNSRHSSGTPKNASRRSSIGSVDYTDIPAEMLSLKERVIILQAQNKKLLHENELLRSHLRSQEVIFEEFQKEARSGKASDIERVLNQQIVLLKQQRDELLLKLEEVNYTSIKYNDLLDEKSKLEDCVRREKELVRQRTHEKEKLEIELLRERLSLERQIREHHRLHELIKHKDLLERELYRQKDHLEGELGLAESKLKDTESVVSEPQQKTIASEGQIQEEMGKLSTEIQNKVKTIQQPVATSSPLSPRFQTSIDSGSYRSQYDRSYHSSSSSGQSSRHSRRHGSGGANTKSGSSSGGCGRRLKLECGCLAELDTMKMMAQCQYHIAIEKLRTDLRRIDTQRKSKRK